MGSNCMTEQRRFYIHVVSLTLASFSVGHFVTSIARGAGRSPEWLGLITSTLTVGLLLNWLLRNKIINILEAPAHPKGVWLRLIAAGIGFTVALAIMHFLRN